MARIAYIDKRFNKSSVALINKANEIIEEYHNQGYRLTLRQLYYQFVSRDYIKNEQKEYKRLGAVINDARLAGNIDWDAIEDRTRNLQRISTWANIGSIIRSCASSYKNDLWANQDNYVEVWIEKDALTGVIEGICDEWRVPYFACRGYNSQSEQWNAGQRFLRRMNEGKAVHVLHLGDHDPSGLDMTSDNTDRLNMFTDHGDIKIHRLALNMNQVKKYSPPPNPAKPTDSRFQQYKAQFGEKCWELDALEPKVISKLVENKVLGLIDMTQWDEDLALENKSIKKLEAMAKKKY